MRKNAVIILCIVPGIAVLVVAGIFAREEIRKAFLRTIMMTTADPDVLGLVSTDSMEPVTVTLPVKRPERIMTDKGQRETGRTLDRSLVVTAPAAYFYSIYLKEGPGGPQDVGLSVWSRQFDPAQPDAIEWERSWRERSKPDRALTRFERRIEETGEYELRFQVINGVSLAAEQRQRHLTTIVQGDQDKPCEKGFDPELQMATYGAPKGFVAGERSCLQGTHHNAMNYMKLNDDASIRFIVRCTGTGPWGTPIDRSVGPAGQRAPY